MTVICRLGSVGSAIMFSGIAAPYFQLFYRGVDISGDLDTLTTSINYVDHVHGKADEIDVTVHDKDGRWQGSWKPEHGDTMQLTIFDGLGGILPCGVFELDEPNANGSRSGDMMTMRGLAAPITKALRTKRTRGFENQKLRSVIAKVTGDLGLKLEGDIDDLFFKRITQRRERDLEFLKRLAEETGHYFGIRADVAVFTSFKSIDGQDAALQVSRHENGLIDYDFKFKSTGTFAKGKATYLDQDTAKNTEHNETDVRVKTGDTLRLSGERFENPAHAAARLKSEMHYANRKGFTGTVSMVGTTRLIAGNTVELLGFGKYSGKRLIDSSSHSLDRSGYYSTGELVDAR